MFDGLRLLASQVAGFAIAPRVVLGNFSYAKLPMVRDLQESAELLASNPLIAAIAGDETARDELRRQFPTEIRESDPDRILLSDEYLVLDADASQNYVINAALAGANLVCVGPPGTGKSQTIANLIATLSARGKRILFVAEKRAAIDAVLKRLAAAGLDDLVLDLHDGSGSRRQLSQQLSRVLESVSHVPLPTMTAEQESLARWRNTLSSRCDALHQKRDPWGLSVYEIQAQLIGADSSVHSTQRLPDAVLSALGASSFSAAQADLESLVGLGGFDIWRSGSPWLEALRKGSIWEPDRARMVLDATTTLASHTMPTMVTAFRGLIDEVGLSEPTSVSQWSIHLRLLEDVAATLALFMPGVFDLDLSEIQRCLSPLSQGLLTRIGHQVSDAEYRAALRAVKGVSLGKVREPSDIYRAVGAAAQQSELWRQVSRSNSAPSAASDLESAKSLYRQFMAELEGLEAYVGKDLRSLSAEQLAFELERLLDDRSTLYRLPELHRLDQALEQRGLGLLLGEMRERQLTTDQASSLLKYVWLSSILDTLSIADHQIGTFDAATFSRTVKQYAEADRRHIASTPLRIKRAVAENITRVRDTYPQESQLVTTEARKQRRHLPIRQLFQVAPHVLGAVKPCWAMSPLVVSQLLPAEQCFDIAIFDEASQVTPADSIGAIMRASQVVVAGDPHQLPPSPFFLATSDGGDDGGDVDANGLPSGALTHDLESVLDVMSALLPAPHGTRTLRWHYRSRDERLIAFSNAQPTLYDWSLVTFPGVSTSEVPEHYLVPFDPHRVNEDGSAAAEVEKVVELVTRHAIERPSESLGVIAMGIKHAERIHDALRRARLEDPALDEFMSESASEPMFVKNLERVQGDERDAIILTIGYGKLADGRMQYRFGPLNNQGGERRLNVAVTRARTRMTVISSFSSDDMDPSRLRSEGAKMLARYLQYAESGGRDLGVHVRERPTMNPFELDVKRRLTDAGIPLVPQFGVSGYWIDFAAAHPEHPGRMVLAIEADGASYHSSHTARDRDRLRQQHLEGLGWTFHRIWSTEWFHNQEREVTRALESYRLAVANSDSAVRNEARSDDPESAPINEHATTPNGAAPQRDGPPPVSGGRGNITDYSLAELVRLIRWIESDTLLRTEDQLLTEVMSCLGYQRRGSKIVAAINQAIARARQPGMPSERRSPPRPRGSTYRGNRGRRGNHPGGRS